MTEPVPRVGPTISRLLPATLLTALSGALFVLSFPKYDLDFLIWFALVPFFMTTRGAGGKRGFLLGYFMGWIIEGAGFYWIGYAIREFSGLPLSVAALFFLCWLLFVAFIWGAIGWLLGRCSSSARIYLVLLLWGYLC